MAQVARQTAGPRGEDAQEDGERGQESVRRRAEVDGSTSEAVPKEETS